MQADRLIVHATLVTMDPQRRILSDHGIAIRDGRIAAILPTQALLEQYSAPMFWTPPAPLHTPALSTPTTTSSRCY